MITYHKGDATDPVGSGQKYVIHICNDSGGWGRGFVLAISNKWKEPEKAYREWYKEKYSHSCGHFKLGSIQLVKVSQDIAVINMIAQEGYGSGNRPPIHYDALEQCLEKVFVSAKVCEASIHGPRFGTGLAGGSWTRIEPIIERTMRELSVTIYDL
jgi:O-acetyl-ADP-ribose deacetylase (regulator of RNase III)